MARAADPDALVAGHPHATAINALRALIRGLDPSIQEGVKWNAPSFWTTEHFATFNLRHRVAAQLVLHLGARSRADVDLRTVIADPNGLLDWRGPDRAVVVVADPAGVETNASALAGIIRRWITFVR